MYGKDWKRGYLAKELEKQQTIENLGLFSERLDLEYQKLKGEKMPENDLFTNETVTMPESDQTTVDVRHTRSTLRTAKTKAMAEKVVLEGLRKNISMLANADESHNSRDQIDVDELLANFTPQQRQAIRRSGRAEGLRAAVRIMDTAYDLAVATVENLNKQDKVIPRYDRKKSG
jgi:hypothetical protein